MADALFTIDAIADSTPLKYTEIADAQNKDEKFKRLLKSRASRLQCTNCFIFADIFTGKERIYLPKKIPL